ncbi:MAG: histidine phosphatase family protein [Actinomycetales bacterium]|nr:histidine phosphatase family protein [Actinomycetales bacterium]
MPDTRQLVLVRHGRTSWNLTKRAQGHTDIELDEVGHRQGRGYGSLRRGTAPGSHLVE